MATVDRKRAAKPREGGLPSPVAKKAKPAPTAGARPPPLWLPECTSQRCSALRDPCFC
jgi:hypothetical protein